MADINDPAVGEEHMSPVDFNLDIPGIGSSN